MLNALWYDLQKKMKESAQCLLLLFCPCVLDYVANWKNISEWVPTVPTREFDDDRGTLFILYVYDSWLN